MQIDKLITIFKDINLSFESEYSIYIYLRNKEFMFGDFVYMPDFINKISWDKFNFFEKNEFWYLFSLFLLFSHKKNNLDFKEVLNSFLVVISTDKSESLTLERRIQQRIFSTENKIKFMQRNDFKILFFVDYFAFNHLLDNDLNSSFIPAFKYNIASLLRPLFNKAKKNRNEKYFWKKIEQESSQTNVKDESDALVFKQSEKKYRFEFFYLSIWLDMDFSSSEQNLFDNLLPAFYLNESEQMESIEFIEHYIFSEEKRIFHFHPKVKQLKLKLQTNIQAQLQRNKEKISKEIVESRELLVLLRKSTKMSLNMDEKAKVREQLMDILKVIPSFSILMLPAGTVILPLILKILPKKTLYPSSFLDDDFKIETQKEE